MSSILVIVYKGKDLDVDLQINTIAKNCKGKEIGSGYNFRNDERDIHIEFKSEKKVKECVDQVSSYIKTLDDPPLYYRCNY